MKKIGLQLFHALNILEECHIIHCDMKPENILLMHLTRPNIKLIDLGSSCYENRRMYTYIQSRFYRAPEVILGAPYTTAIDVWSLGCVFVELYTGIPLFAGENEFDQLLCMMEVLGVPPPLVFENASRKNLFFEANGEPKIKPNSRGKRRIPGTRALRSVLKGADEEFCQIIEDCLRWDPEHRLKPAQAVKMPWFQETNTETQRGLVYKHRKISLEDITKHVPNLQKFIAHRTQLSIT